MNANIFKSAITEGNKKVVMKDFLRIIVVAALLLSVQNAFAQIDYGIKLGGNFSKMKFNGVKEINDNDIKMRPGFCVGIFVNDKLEGSILSLESGLNIETKGYNYKTTNEIRVSGVKIKGTGSVNIVYATIPANVRLNFGGFYLMAGPYFSVGIMGRTSSNAEVSSTVKNKTTTESAGYSGDIDFESDYKRSDAGVSFGFGETIGKIGIRFNYALGLLNILQDKSNKQDKNNKYEATNRTLSCALTCHF